MFSSSCHVERMHGHPFSRGVFLLVGCLLAGLLGCQKSAPPPPPAKPLTVQFVLPETRMITEQEEFTGRTAATERVELRARVSGYLQVLDFPEGRLVQKGQVLFRIDDRPFRAEEKRTQAAVAQFERGPNGCEVRNSGLVHCWKNAPCHRKNMKLCSTN